MATTPVVHPVLYYAHSANPAGEWHPLASHLSRVAALSRQFAGNARWAEEAELAGLLHDIGKFADRFQERLRGADRGLDHWSIGAWIALTSFGAQAPIAAALAIQGHHTGLQQADLPGLRRLDPRTLARHHPQHLQLSDPDPQRLRRRADADGLVFAAPTHTALPPKGAMAHAAAAMLDVRLLFSCLVDADFLDTESHFEGAGHRPAGPALDPAAALAALDRFMGESVRSGSRADPRVLQVREALWQQAIDAARGPLGPFTFTAPTGAGKTLAMLKFALEHAAHHGLRRIVVVVPFLTIIEQTAQVYRAVFKGFPQHFVLEHHSLAGMGPERERADAEGPAERERRLLAENWDAPIVLTTNVQLLESLFSNRPAACRKLHNLMDSVLLFDEAQSLPSALSVPTLAALSHLATAYRASVVFATATQPAFDTLHEAVHNYAGSGWQPVEAVPGHPALFAALARVRVAWPAPGERRSWSQLAEELGTATQVLCVVNLKRHARALLKALEGVEGLFHLSTNLCAEHRRAVLAEVRERLVRGQPCRLISTQCVEAGVDVDFPLVYRALAPLEAIAQAAGRCNREGRLAHGRMVVFEPDEEGGPRGGCPTFAYFQATEVTRSLLAERGPLDLDDPALFRDYYRRLYDRNNPAARHPELTEALTAGDFARVAALYRLIDQDAIQVLVPWSGQRERVEELRAQAGQGIGGAWMRAAQTLAVSLYRPRADHPAWGVLIPAPLRGRQGTSDEWYLLEDPDGRHYHDTHGLLLPESDPIFIA